MYKYFLNIPEKEADAISLSEGRVHILGDKHSDSTGVAARHYAFLVDFMKVNPQEILFLALRRSSKNDVKDVLHKCFNLSSVKMPVYSIMDFCMKLLDNYSYIIISDIDAITKTHADFVNKLIARNKNVYICGNIENAVNDSNWEALKIMTASDADEECLVGLRMSSLLDRAAKMINDRINVEREREITKEKEKKEKMNILAELLSSIDNYVQSYNPIGKTQYWVMRLTKNECLHHLASNIIEDSNVYFKSNSVSGIKCKEEFMREYRQNSNAQFIEYMFHSWWNFSKVIQDNDIVVLHDYENDQICGVGRFFNSKNTNKAVVWIDKTIRHNMLVYDKLEWNPIRIKGTGGVKQIEVLINTIIRGY